MTVGKNLRQLRAERGLTQEQFHAVQELAGRAIDTFGMLRR